MTVFEIQSIESLNTLNLYFHNCKLQYSKKFEIQIEIGITVIDCEHPNSNIIQSFAKYFEL